MTREKELRQWHRRHWKSSVPTLYEAESVGAADYGSYGRRVPHPIAAGLLFILAAILVSPIWDGVARTTGVGSGVLAAPCVTSNTTAGGSTTVSVFVTPTTGLNLTMFNCEGGDFEVFWSGVVNVPDTIYIGLGTTVNIMGDTSPVNTSDAAAVNETSSTINSTGEDGVDDLIAMLSIPRGLTSAAVRVATSDVSTPANESIGLGPIFYVDGGELLLENMAIRGGAVINSTEHPAASGAAIHAQNASVTATWCEFEDNFAELEGGAVFAHGSTLVVVSSVFRRCQAGFRPEAGDKASAAGGGISSNDTDTFILGCLFEDCYAGKKGGGMTKRAGGKMSVLQSGFYNNSAGSDSVKDAAEVGEAGAMSISMCDLSFDGQDGCTVNDTVFAYNHVARKGAAVNIATGPWPSRVKFNRCTVANNTAGENIEDDPQGEGGVLNVAPGNWLLLADSLFEDNNAGNKGGVVSLSSGTDWEYDPGSTLILRNSTFKANTADAGNGGVVSLASFTTLVVAGDGNVFEGNTCGDDGGVFGATSDTNTTVEGGVFRENQADVGGGVVWTKGAVEVQGGLFHDNRAKDIGGVLYSADGSSTLLAGGLFEGNKATDGGVVYAGSDSQLFVSSGEFLDNEATNRGGALFVNDDGMLEITGGSFSENEADFGGFLYK